jgi:hypothetical protein
MIERIRLSCGGAILAIALYNIVMRGVVGIPIVGLPAFLDEQIMIAIGGFITTFAVLWRLRN